MALKAKTSEVYPNVMKIDAFNIKTQFFMLFLKTSEVFYIRHFIIGITLVDIVCCEDYKINPVPC